MNADNILGIDPSKLKDIKNEPPEAQIHMTGMKVRYRSVDLMRAIAIILMIPCHFILFFSPYEEPFQGLYTLGNDILGGLSAPLFLFVLGLSQAICTGRRPDYRSLFDPTGAKMIRRGVLLFFFGFLLKLGLEAPVFEWGILTLIGVSMLALAYLRKHNAATLIAISITIFVAAPFLRHWVGYLSYWEPNYTGYLFDDFKAPLFMDVLTEFKFGTDSTLSRVLTGLFVTSYFPLFPWLLFPILGMAMGRLFYGEQPKSWVRWTTLVAGGGLITGAFFIANQAISRGYQNIESGFITGFTFFPTTPALLLLQVGVCLVALVAFKGLDKAYRPGILTDYFSLISRYSLSLYVLHYLFAYWTTQAADFLYPENANHMGDMVSTPIAIVLSIVFLQSAYFLFKLWDQKEGKYAPEWVLKQVG